MAKYLYFNSRDELLRIDVKSIVYIEADGNYSKIVLGSGFNGMVGFNLAKMEKMLVATMNDDAGKFARIGKCYIVNLNYVLKINPLKQELVLSDQHTFSFNLAVSKDALKKLKEVLTKSKKVK